MDRDTVTACLKSGMPIEHARCFQRVADSSRCVISSRSVGIYSTGLIRENYASKGFWVKAKSCNWGPMAGFTLSDPRFTKRGGSPEARESQRKDIQAGLNHDASEMQVFITDDRRKTLEGRAPAGLACMQRVGGNINEMIYSASSSDGKAMKFVLRREMNAPGANGLQLWGVLFRGGGSSRHSPASQSRHTRKPRARDGSGSPGPAPKSEKHLSRHHDRGLRSLGRVPARLTV